jgi:hypothetical protein
MLNRSRDGAAEQIFLLSDGEAAQAVWVQKTAARIGS